MNDTDKKVANNTVYQFGVNNSNKDLDMERILDDLDAINKLRDLSAEVAERADREEWSLEKILDKVDALYKVKSNKEKEDETFDENLPVWSISLFGNTSIKSKKKEDK